MVAVSKEVVREMLDDSIDACRREVDVELRRLHAQDRANAWTEERARKLAEQAADLAVKKITDNFYMGVGKKTVASIGATIVVLSIYWKDEVAKWLASKLS